MGVENIVKGSPGLGEGESRVRGVEGTGGLGFGRVVLYGDRRP